jgi:hypothetical protein
MTGRHWLELVEATPFLPFDILLANGDRVRVEHPECVHVSETGRIVQVTRPDDSFLLLDLLLVLAFDVSPPRAPVQS